LWRLQSPTIFAPYTKNVLEFDKIKARMKKINFSKIIVFSLLILIAAGGTIAYTVQRYINGSTPSTLTQIINDGTASIDSLFSSPGNYLRAKAGALGDLMTAQQQNQALKQQLSNMTAQSQKLAAEEADNRSLRAALNLKSTLSSYSTVAATVINRSASSWNDLLIIDQGSQSGLKAGMMVMAKNAIIGKVSQVNTASSKVELLTGATALADKISVQLGDPTKPTYGLLTKYDSNLGYYEISQIRSSQDFKNGESVVTSGLSGGIPSNLTLGTIVGQQGKSTDLSRIIYVKPVDGSFDARIVTVVQAANG